MAPLQGPQVRKRREKGYTEERKGEKLFPDIHKIKKRRKKIIITKKAISLNKKKKKKKAKIKGKQMRTTPKHHSPTSATKT